MIDLEETSYLLQTLLRTLFKKGGENYELVKREMDRR